MNADQIQAAAIAAIRAMDPAARAAFVEMFEAGQHENAQTVAQAYAVEGVSRQIRLCSVVLENSRKMQALTEIVYDEVTAPTRIKLHGRIGGWQ